MSPVATAESRTHSLNDVRAIIPATCYHRSKVRATVALVQAALLYLAPIAALVFTDTWWLLLVLWPLAGLGVSGLFVLGHDASHMALFESRRMNRFVARWCMAPGMHAEAAWDLGHNRVHHGYTTRQGFDFVWHPVTPAEYRELSLYGRLRHRLEWSCVGAGAYFLRSVWWDKMWRFNAEGKRRGEIIRDKAVLTVLAVVAIGGTAVGGALTGGWLTAIWLPFKLFVVPFLIFVNVVGWAVYVHHVAPDIRWWERKQWSQFRGQMESTTILRLPRLVNRLWMHNIMVHIPHHVDARIPFHKLPEAARAIAASFPETVRSARYSVRTYIRNTRVCKLYDFEAGRWLPYAAARRAATTSA
jgi:omega-6 fatty acid desaturase (delta-12 desaturase)